MKLPIYMDNQSTTPVDPQALEAMMPYYREEFGNAASRNHSFGRDALRAVEEARAKVAAL
ncbi:MAG: aminotransferase class V-fold PLP-dependent enzyme, partial [Candidatus Omnitrophica bacterium]|nr:aminotransferase class V-fold PLP-dependent enzyme [Candidatus Omnitrophota bacterium]